MPDVLIRNVPKTVLKSAKSVAEAHHRTLQQELQLMLAEGVHFARGHWAQKALHVKGRLRRSRITFSDSASLLSRDRRR